MWWVASGTVPLPPLHLAVDDPAVVEGLALVRTQQHVPGPHPPEIEVAVVAVDDDGSTVVCRDPAVQSRVVGDKLGLGDEVTLRVASADPVQRRVVLEPA